MPRHARRSARLTHKPAIEMVVQTRSLAKARGALLDGRLEVAVVDL